MLNSVPCNLFPMDANHMLLQGQFQPNMAQHILQWREIKFLQMKNYSFWRGDYSIYEIFSRTTFSSLTKIGIDLLEERPPVFQKKKGPQNFPREDKCSSKIVKIHRQFLGVERSSISLCRRSEQAQWFLRELIYSSDIHPQKYNPLNILHLSRFQNIVEYSNINIDNAH